MPVGDLLPEIAVLMTAVINLLFVASAAHSRQWLGALLCLGGLTLAFVLALQQLDTDKLTFSGVWAIDGAGVVAKLLILAAATFTVLLSPGWLMNDRRHGEYYSILLLATLGAIVLTGANDTMQLIMGTLLSSVTGYVLAAYHRNWSLSLEAGMKFFLIGALTNVLLLIGVVLLFGIFSSTDYQTIATLSAGESARQIATAPLFIAVGMVIVGISFKLGALPAQAWLPDVAEGAPLPSAAFLTVVPKIGAALALARFLTLFPADLIDWPLLIAVIAAATMTLGNLGALWQEDLRRLLGWSAISQSGYVLAAVAVLDLSERGLSALLFFLVAYATANLTAFAVVTQLRGRTRIADYTGLARSRPWLSAALVLSLLSLVGIPPLVGFGGKLLIFTATIDADYSWLAVAVVLNTLVSLFYYLRFVAPIYLETSLQESPQPAQVLGAWSAAAVLCGSVAVVLLGLAAESLLGEFAGWAL